MSKNVKNSKNVKIQVSNIKYILNNKIEDDVLNNKTLNDNKLISKISENFQSSEQQLFAKSFLIYTSFKKDEFCIDLDNIWKWIGFTRKDNAKRLLLNPKFNFEESVDYLIFFAPLLGGAKIEEENVDYLIKTAPLLGGAVLEENDENRGGHNKEQILLTVKSFKKLCLKAGTDRADQIHDYYIKLEEILHEVIKEEQIEYKNQLEDSKKELIIQKEQNILTNFSKKTLVYVGIAEIINENGKITIIIKFGWTDDIETRIGEHKSTYRPEFTFEYIYESQYAREIEKQIKKHPIISHKIMDKIYNGRKRIELIKLDDSFTLKDLDKIIKEIKENVELIETNKDKDSEINLLKLKILELEKENAKINSDKENKVNELKVENEKKDDKINQLTKEDVVVRKVDDLINNINKFEKFKQYSKVSVFCNNIVSPKIIKEYLDKQRQSGGYIFYSSENSPYWKPPQNFKYRPEQKSNTKMIYLKTIHKKTKEITYYNNLVEAIYLLLHP